MSERVTARYRRGKVHLFSWTVGGPEDGSLYGQGTRCGHVVSDIGAWSEDGAEVTCGTCLRLDGSTVGGYINRAEAERIVLDMMSPPAPAGPGAPEGE